MADNCRYSVSYSVTDVQCICTLHDLPLFGFQLLCSVCEGPTVKRSHMKEDIVLNKQGVSFIDIVFDVSVFFFYCKRNTTDVFETIVLILSVI